ncbi:MAG: hypothetical protein R3254_07435 [Thiomicrorhabdus sp.]|nr:hypothetical protein [Thiomicrorhabdus sp.]
MEFLKELTQFLLKKGFEYVAIFLAGFGVFYLGFSECSPIDIDNIIDSGKTSATSFTKEIIDNATN